MTWPELVGAFVAGTSRSGVSENDVLNDAALVTSMRRAGVVFPSAGPEPVVPAPSEDAPPLDAGVGHLRQCFDESEHLVVEWCTAAAEAGWRAPDALLPDLLEFLGRRRPGSSRVAAALGARGRWLAGLNEAWRPLVAPSTTHTEEEMRQAWPEWTHPERLAALSTQLAEFPDLRRELIQSTWKEESAKVRTAFVDAIANRPTPDDVPFLEGCLTDRSTEVRYRAAHGLVRLRVQPFSDDAVALAREFVQVSPKVRVEAPEGNDPRLDRFGIPSVKGAASVEQRVGRLSQLLVLVPPYHWEEAGDRPATLIRQIGDGAVGNALYSGWMGAALWFNDLGWAEALIGANHRNRYAPAELLDMLPREAQERLARELWPSLNHETWWRFSAIALTDDPWSAEFTRDFLRKMFDDVALRRAKIFPDSFRDAALFMDPFAATLNEDVPEHWQPVVDRWRRILEFRRSMLQTIQGSPKP